MLRSSTDKTVCYVANWIVGIYDSIFKISIIDMTRSLSCIVCIEIIAFTLFA